MTDLKKIVVIGPESTGKSSLCEDLATYFHTFWCEEYARLYLSEHGKDYQYMDLVTIAKGQLQLESQTIERGIKEAKRVVFIDTDLYVMKVWSEYVFGKCDNFILDGINNQKYDLYLLADIDLPWTKDDLREYPNEKPRKELFNIYKDILINQTVPWGIVSGIGDERLQNAIQLIRENDIV